MPDFLLELFSEEIPARMQTRAADDLKRLVTGAMVEAGLTYEAAAAFSTPRRLALSVTGLPKATPLRREERKGPRTDAPEKALEGFLRSTGLAKDQLEARDDKKGQVWFAVIETPGRPATEALAEIVAETVHAFPWPKSMRWGDGALRWVRPLHSVLCILSDEAGTEIVPVEIGGVAAGGETRGHRFMGDTVFAPKDFDDYVARLDARRVVLDPAERRARIEADMTNLAFAQGFEIAPDPGLLEEVAGLVEWPVVLMGDIGEAFLDLPPEVLRTSMKEHQKFFSVTNPKTRRIEKYVTVANIEAPDEGASILAGNSRVLTARLSDAKFFWENDLRVATGAGGLDAMAGPLAKVTFHNKLGSQSERIERMAALAREIAPHVAADPDLAERAAAVCKADLASEMVYEFPELQGVMGRYYAGAADLPDEVAVACSEHYRPLGPSDRIPESAVSVAVALADKLDLLVCFWAIDERPTGSKDPFALRRAANGVLRIIIENRLTAPLASLFTSHYRRADISVRDALKGKLTRRASDAEPADPPVEETASVGDHAVAPWKDGREIDSRAAPLLDFIADRLKHHLRGEGVRHDVIDACFLLGEQDDLLLLVSRVRALQDFVETDDGANLLAGYKRAANILAAEEKKDGIEYSLDPDPKFAEEPAENDLFAALDSAGGAIAKALANEDFAAAMTAMAGLRRPIDAFFDDVTVNAENAVVRRNRLCLLSRVKTVMERVARFSALEG